MIVLLYARFSRRLKSSFFVLAGLILFGILLIGPPTVSQAADSINVAYCVDSIPFHFKDKDGNPSGMLIDFWKLWSQKTGVKVKFIPSSWDESIDLVKLGKADAHAGLFFSKQRSGFLDFGTALAKTDTHIFYHESLPQLVAGNELLPYRVGVIAGDFVEGYLKENVPGIFIAPYSDYQSLMADLKSGQIKTFAADTPTALYFLEKYDLSGRFQFHASRPLYQNDWFLAVPKGDDEFLGRIDVGMSRISDKEKLAIVRKWAASGQKRDEDTIIIAMDRNFPPFYFVDTDGKPKGLLIDIWTLWAERTNTKIDFRPSDWKETLSALRNGVVDLHSGLFKNKQRSEWIDFSTSNYEVPNAVFFRDGDTPVPLSQMTGKKVGVIGGTDHERYVREEYPDVITVPTLDSNGLIIGLLKGSFDAIVNETINIENTLDSMGFKGMVKRHSENLYYNAFHGGVLKGNEALLEKVNNGLKLLTLAELAQLEEKWIVDPKNRYYSRLAAVETLDLTPDEFSWLRKHPVIRISNEMDWPPYDFVDRGLPTGFSVDYLKLVAGKLGLNIDWISDRPWKELVQMAKDKELDVLQSVVKTAAREEFLTFPPPYHTSATVIFARTDEETINGISSLAGKKVAVVEGFNVESLLQKRYPDIELVRVKNPNEGLTYVSVAKADAYIDRQTVCQYYVKKNNIPNVAFASMTGVPELDTKDMYMGVRKDWPELASILGKGMYAVTEDELAELREKWFGIAKPSAIGLTREERLWIRQNPTIRVAATYDWPPFESKDGTGKYAGITADFLRIAAKRAGLNLAYNFDSWSTLLDRLEKKELDLAPGLVRSSERENFLLFTEPFISSNDVILVKTSNEDIHALDDLNGHTVAVEKGYYNEEFLRKDFPEVKLYVVQSTIDALKAVVKGKADAYIGMQAVSSYLIDKYLVRGLKVGAYVDGHDISLAVGVRDDYPLLRSIMEKAYASITPLERKEITQRYLRQETDVAHQDLRFTPEEIEWMNENPVVRIAATPNWPPFEFEENEKYKGVAADILGLVAERTGLKTDVRFSDWNTVLSRLRDGEADIAPAIVKTTDREKYLDFTTPVFVSQVGIWVEKGTNDIKSMDDLRGKIVAVEDGYATHELLKASYPDISLSLVKSPIDAIRLVSTKQADAYLGNQAAATYLQSKHVIMNLKVVGYFKDASRDLRMGVPKNLPLLKSILDKGLSTVTLRERNTLLAKYINNASVQPDKEELVLSDEEDKWIRTHKNIRLGVDTSWQPFEFFDGPSYSGLSAEYIRRLSNATGLTFTPPPVLNWMDVIDLAKSKKLDVLPSVGKTPEREKYLQFSKAYGSYPIVVYQRTNDTPIRSLGELDGKRVAVVEGYAVEELLGDNHSNIVLQPYKNTENALNALSKGMVDAMAGNVVVVEAAKQRISVFNVAPSIKTPYIQDLRFGVRDDWPQLVSIIDKWLDTLDPEMRAKLADEAGIVVNTALVSAVEAESMDTKQLLMVGVGIISAFGAALMILLFLRGIVQKRAATLYSSHQYKVVGIVIGILFLCLVVVATWLALKQVEDRARYNVGEALESVVLTTHEALSIWEKQNKKYMIELVESPTLRGMTAAILSLPEEEGVIKSSPQLWNIRRHIDKVMKTRGFIDYSIVSKNFVNYASKRDDDLLDKNAVSIQRPRVLDKVFLGNTVFVPPVRLVMEGEDGQPNEMSIVSMAAPIKSPDGKIVAALVLNYDASDNYQRIISLGMLGQTGETYAFDKNGSLVSQSRYSELLEKYGLLDKGEKAILNLRIADPGGNLLEGHVLDEDVVLPLTQAAMSATQRHSGVNIDGYRDYRGVAVFGAWLWDEDLGVGLVTEMDVDEALGSFRLVQSTVISIILITILLGTLMTGLSNWIGQSAAKSLEKAKDELEDRVEERTAELKKISVAVEQSPSTVVITNTDGIIEYVNPMFTESTGYTAEEAIGQNPRVLKSGDQSEGFYKELWDTIMAGKIWNGDFLNKKKNGELFWERASIAPIVNDEGILTHFVAVKEDITERKAQEERFQALLDAAPDAMVIVAHDGSIGLVNIATEELFEYTREEMIGQKVEMLLPEYIREKHPAYRDAFFDRPGDMTLVANKDFKGQTKSGNIVPIDIGLSPIETADGIQIIASIRDITERKKAEEAIAHSEERTRLILSSAGEGIFGVNLKGNVIFINDAACQMVGYTSDELMGKAVHDIIHHSRADGSFYPVEECPMRHAFVEGLSSRIDNEVLWRKDGTSFPVEYSAMPIKRGAEMFGAVISFQDITERRAMEDALLGEKVKTEDALAVVTSSIQYASRIQRSVLPSDWRLEEVLTDYFVVWEPRDVVGGDFYHCELWGEGAVVLLGDCTGHGVPGAFMTLLTTGALENTLPNVSEGDCGTLISKMHQMIQSQLDQNKEVNSEIASDDGLELGVCYIAPDGNTLIFSGARMPLFMDYEGEISQIKPDKKGVGYRGIPSDFEYTNKTIELKDGMTFYMTTDGLIDQIGGEKRRGFGKKRFISLLDSLRQTPLQKQGDAIYSELKKYQGKEKRRDDVSFIGFTI